MKASFRDTRIRQIQIILFFGKKDKIIWILFKYLSSASTSQRESEALIKTKSIFWLIFYTINEDYP